MVLREEPRPGSAPAAPNVLASVEFAHADLPWLLSPGQVNTGAGPTPLPWIVLVVLDEEEAAPPCREPVAGAHRTGRGAAAAGGAVGVGARGGPPGRRGHRPGGRAEGGRGRGAQPVGRRDRPVAVPAEAASGTAAGSRPWCPRPRPGWRPGCAAPWRVTHAGPAWSSGQGPDRPARLPLVAVPRRRRTARSRSWPAACATGTRTAAGLGQPDDRRQRPVARPERRVRGHRSRWTARCARPDAAAGRETWSDPAGAGGLRRRDGGAPQRTRPQPGARRRRPARATATPRPSGHRSTAATSPASRRCPTTRAAG